MISIVKWRKHSLSVGNNENTSESNVMECSERDDKSDWHLFERFTCSLCCNIHAHQQQCIFLIRHSQRVIMNGFINVKRGDRNQNSIRRVLPLSFSPLTWHHTVNIAYANYSLKKRGRKKRKWKKKTMQNDCSANYRHSILSLCASWFHHSLPHRWSLLFPSTHAHIHTCGPRALWRQCPRWLKKVNKQLLLAEEDVMASPKQSASSNTTGFNKRKNTAQHFFFLNPCICPSDFYKICTNSESSLIVSLAHPVFIIIIM